ncbi:DNA-binding protein [Leptolyngbya sp. 'hensonii']|uniref:DNA-binding protein n=1 Tax=Leptolyngbya sp. 'hensonii' TaxID=1922337 RepID=UPI00094F7DEC|nr:DNA-binding protein [Leptolyngbya sp. 'hensonii']OLP17517.1 DNA-binding protein [Leptolyngbya sp. 'hensonii']
MQKIIKLAATLSIISLLFSPLALAQLGKGGRGSGGWGRNSQYQRLYNLNTVTTITGKVIAVDNQVSMRGMSTGVHVKVSTANGNILVHLGPAWYLGNQDVQIELGDQIEVTGSQVTLAGVPVIIAAKIRKGDQILTLRDQNGFPVWSGWRKQ